MEKQKAEIIEETNINQIIKWQTQFQSYQELHPTKMVLKS